MLNYRELLDIPDIEMPDPDKRFGTTRDEAETSDKGWKPQFNPYQHKYGDTGSEGRKRT